MQVTTTAQSSLPLKQWDLMAKSTSSHTPFDEFLASTKSRYPSFTVTTHCIGSDGHWALIEGSPTQSSPLASTHISTAKPHQQMAPLTFCE